MKLNLENSHFLTESVRESNELKFAARTGRVRKESKRRSRRATVRRAKERPETAGKGQELQGKVYL